MMVVGKYYGPDGAVVIAIIAPIWNVLFGFGMLTDIGASILFNIQKKLIKLMKRTLMNILQ